MSITREAVVRRLAAAGVPLAGTAPVNSRFGVILSLFALYIIWGSTYLAIRIAIESFPPFMMAGIRFLVAGGGLYLFMRLRGAPNPPRRQWLGAGVIGMFLLVGGNAGVTFAEQWVPSGLTAVGVATMPLWAAVFGGIFGRWPGRGEWLGLGLGFVGVILLNLENGLRANPLGAGALVLATMSWAFGSTLSRRVSLPSGLMGSAAEMLVAGALISVLSFASGEQLHAVPSERSVLALIYLIVFGSLVAYSAYVFLLARVRPTLATSYAYVNPVVAVALGVGLAGERITVLGLVAMVVILAGVVLVLAARDKGPGAASAKSG